MSDAELKVASATLDADGSGSVSFSEFYAWFAAGGGGGGVSNTVDGLGELLSDDAESWSTQRSDYSRRTPPLTGRTERSRLGGPPSVASAGGRLGRRKRGPGSAARSTFVRVGTACPTKRTRRAR